MSFLLNKRQLGILKKPNLYKVLEWSADNFIRKSLSLFLLDTTRSKLYSRNGNQKHELDIGNHCLCRLPPLIGLTTARFPLIGEKVSLVLEFDLIFVKWYCFLCTIKFIFRLISLLEY